MLAAAGAECPGPDDRVARAAGQLHQCGDVARRLLGREQQACRSRARVAGGEPGLPGRQPGLQTVGADGAGQLVLRLRSHGCRHAPQPAQVPRLRLRGHGRCRHGPHRRRGPGQGLAGQGLRQHGRHLGHRRRRHDRVFPHEPSHARGQRRERSHDSGQALHREDWYLRGHPAAHRRFRHPHGRLRPRMRRIDRRQAARCVPAFPG